MKALCISITLLGLSFLSHVFGGELSNKERKELKCSVCRALVHEMNTKIEEIDPRKTVNVGSYRIDGEGNQKGTRQVNYARSEIHLVDVIEKACEEMSKYTLATLKNGKKTIISILNTEKHVNNIIRSKNNVEVFKGMCHSIVGEHEEEIIDLYIDTNNPLAEMSLTICAKAMADKCTGGDFDVTFPHNDDDIDVDLSHEEDGEAKDNDEDEEKSPNKEEKDPDEEIATGMGDLYDINRDEINRPYDDKDERDEL